MTPRLVRLSFAVVFSLAALLVRAQTPPTAPAPADATAAPAPAKPEEDQMLQQLKLPDADIDTVLNTLELLTGRVVLRPASLPTATYNLKITRPLPKSEAVLYIETVLALNGVGVAPQGDKALVVTPLTLTRTSAPEMITGSAFDQPPSGKPATKIFLLDFLRVQEFAGMIQGIQNPNYAGGTVQLPNANAILVTDSVANLQRIEALIQQIDKPSTNGLKPKFYTLRNGAKASDVVGKLRTILTGTLQIQLGQATSYSADDRSNQIILITDPRQYPLFDDLIAKLDVKSDPNTRNDVIYLKHADAQQVATLLTQLVSGQTGAAQRSNSQSVRPGQGVASQLPLPTAPGTPTPAGPVAPGATSGTDALGGTGANEFSTLVTVIPDIRANAIVVSGTADDLRLIKEIIDKLDIILAQVRIEVVMAEVNLDDNHSSGISQLGLTIAGDKLVGFSGTEASTTVTNGTVTRPGGTTPVSGPFDLAATLTINTTPRKSNTTILSQPSITTSHAKQAKFFFGETRPVVTGTTSTPTAATTTTGFSTSSQVQQQQIGTTVTVKPLIGNDGSVQLDITLDISDVTGNVQIDNNTQYIIGQRTTNSFITAQSGDILVMGGIQKQKNSKSTSRLGPIPILGDLFGSRNKEDQRTEVIVFIRPVVLTGTAAVDNASTLKRVDALETREAILKEIDPKYQPPPKTLLEKILPK